MDECLICKKHYSQGGKCTYYRRNCIEFEEEPRGKMVYTTLDIAFCPGMQVFMKCKEKVILEDDREFTILKVIAVDFAKSIVPE